MRDFNHALHSALSFPRPEGAGAKPLLACETNPMLSVFQHYIVTTCWNTRCYISYCDHNVLVLYMMGMVAVVASFRAGLHLLL